MAGLSGLTGPSGLSGIFGGGFLPTDLAGLILWLKADAGTFQDSLYTVPAVADGDPVGGWQDQSGHASHVIQGAAANKPILKLNIKNGLPAIKWDGTNDYLQGAFTTGALSQPYTVFAVAQLNAAVTADGNQYTIMDSDDAVNRMMLRKTTANVWGIYAGSGVQGNAANANWNIWSVLFNGASSEFWINGVSDASGNAGAHNADGIIVGDRQPLGAVWKDYITEILIYDPSLSTANRQLVEQYLSSRWGI